MKHRFKSAYDTVAHKGGFFMFLRAQFASQIASITDFSVTIILKYLFDVFYVYATFLGSVCGGIVNCIINYRWTFRSTDVKKRYVAMKYLFVWVCSILLNTGGTYGMTELLKRWCWLREALGHLSDDVFLVSKIIVSLLVGFVWNYNMQRFFVYRDMDFKNTFMKSRDFAQQTIYKIINPVVRGMIKIGITPNFITLTGLILNSVACFVLIYGAMNSERSDYSYVGWAGAIILFAGLFDMMDGQVARIGKMSSRYGAMFDSVLDRYSELIVFFGICYYLGLKGYIFSSLFAFIALIGSVMVSYVRARAEGLGIECKGGFMQRPERVVITALGAIGCGVYAYFAGDHHVYQEVCGTRMLVFEPILIFVIPIVFVAVFANITAFGRLRHCKHVLTELDGAVKNPNSKLG